MTFMDFSYRHAEERDIPGLLHVMSRVKYLDFVYRGDEVRAMEDLNKKISAGFGVLVCVKPCDDEENCILNQRILGYFIYGPFDPDGKLASTDGFPKPVKQDYAYHLGVGVDPDFLGQGIARILTDIALEECRDKYKGMYADVAEPNSASIKLQNRCGFSEVARFPDPKRSGAVTVLFRIDF